MGRTAFGFCSQFQVFLLCSSPPFTANHAHSSLTCCSFAHYRGRWLRVQYCYHLSFPPWIAYSPRSPVPFERRVCRDDQQHDTHTLIHHISLDKSFGGHPAISTHSGTWWISQCAALCIERQSQRHIDTVGSFVASLFSSSLQAPLLFSSSLRQSISTITLCSLSFIGGWFKLSP